MESEILYVETNVSQKRIVYFDLLRIVAAFSVVMLHSSAQFWYSLDVSSTEWKIANSYDALFRFGVPIFVMISGALWLGDNRELNLKKLYTRNILRFMIIYIIWSCVYGLIDCTNFEFELLTWKDIAREMLLGRYHLWFLPMIVGLYVLLPILRSWIHGATKQNLQYFLILFFVLQICRETIYAMSDRAEIHYILEIMKIDMVCSYLGYFVLGYYLMNIEISPKLRHGIYFCVIPAAALNIILSISRSVKTEEPNGAIYDCFGLFTFLIVVAIFLFFKEVMGKVSYSDRTAKILREIASDTLGVYVMHLGVMDFADEYGINSMMVPNIVGIPLFALICFIVCCMLAAVLRRIPFLGRFIC